MGPVNPKTAGKLLSTEGHSSNDRGTIYIMMYLFPRQFGLHNVFTSETDPRQTVQAYMDYTLREDEISAKYPSPTTPKIPRRLRGRATDLVRKLQIQHSRCSYKHLIEHYCPVSYERFLNVYCANSKDFRERIKSSNSKPRHSGVQRLYCV